MKYLIVARLGFWIFVVSLKTFQYETCVKFAMTLSDWSLFVLLWLIISTVGMQIVVERPPAYVMHCNANKHVTDALAPQQHMCQVPIQHSDVHGTNASAIDDADRASHKH